MRTLMQQAIMIMSTAAESCAHVYTAGEWLVDILPWLLSVCQWI